MILTGGSTRIDSMDAGMEAAARVAGRGSGPAWALAFCSGRHDPTRLLEGIRKELGDIPVYGGAACGVITNDILDYSGYVCGIAAFGEDLMPEVISIKDNAPYEEFSTGRELAEEISCVAEAGDTVLLLFDQLVRPEPLKLFSGSGLLNGFYSHGGMEGMQILGAGLVGDFNFVPSFIFDGTGVEKHKALALVFPRSMSVESRIMHGCTPVSSFLEITGMEGPVVYELDGKRALDVFHDMLGSQASAEVETVIPFTTTLAKKSGDEWAPYDEQAYINSLVIGSDRKKGSVMLFETDLIQGDQVQIMIRDNSDMLESSRKGAERLLNGTRGESLAFYIDCAGRTRDYSSSEREEADLVRQVAGERVPLLGFYSSMEIAPFGDRSRPLNWTGILSVFSHE